jgi:formate hydrogenlyase subunit 3/multisubunit Na+/H+ antiporter MnhD subunit
LAVGAGILTMLYMFRTWQLIFQQAPPDDLELKPEGDSPLAPGILIAASVLLGIYAVPLIDVAQRTVEQLGDPLIYIRAVIGG